MSAVLCAAPAAAQATPGTDPAAPGAASPAWRSAFEGYRPFADAPVAPWRESNDTVGRIGGWRAYAREAQEPAGVAPPAAASRDGSARDGAGNTPARPPAVHRH